MDTKIDNIMENITEEPNLCIIREALRFYYESYEIDHKILNYGMEAIEEALKNLGIENNSCYFNEELSTYSQEDKRILLDELRGL